MTLIPFGAVDECPKCLSRRKDFNVKYRGPDQSRFPAEEHLVVTCMRCEYFWWEECAPANLDRTYHG